MTCQIGYPQRYLVRVCSAVVRENDEAGKVQVHVSLRVIVWWASCCKPIQKF